MCEKGGGMGIYAYLRVSTEKQDVTSQRKAIEDWAEENNVAIDEWFEDSAVSGSVPPLKRPAFSKLWSKLEKGDTLVIFELSRLGRSLKDIVFLADELRKRGVTLISLKEGIDPRKGDLNYNITIGIMGLLAEVERQLIRERTIAGLRRAREQGKRIGRPQKVEARKVLLLLQKGMKPSEIAKILGVSRSTIYSCLRRMRNAGIIERRNEWIVKGKL
ncbi:MAG: recombinase family protein [Thermoprotei archaeon]|nr:MAG: recombinase family protein [Thermoprotei archaeon]